MENHFATLKLVDPDSDRTLTRAFSYSELPFTRQIRMQQSYQSGNPTGLVRQYSCEQIYDEAAKTRHLKISEVVRSTYNESRNAWQSVLPYAPSSNASSWQFSDSSNAIQVTKIAPKETSNEIEYMDVENVDSVLESEFLPNRESIDAGILSAKEQFPCSDSKKLENVTVEGGDTDSSKGTDRNTYDSIKKKLRPLVANTKAAGKRRRSMCCCNLMCICMVPIVVGLISLLINPVTYQICDRSALFLNATAELQQKIYGQENAMASLAYSLNYDRFHLKVICLIGGTGVGKSYTMEIIRKNFPAEKRIVEQNLALGYNIDMKALKSFDSYDLLIVENLKMRDLEVFNSILDALKENEGRCITVFMIFNVENVDDYLTRDVDLIESNTAITGSTGKRNIDISVIPFEPLGEPALEMCIMEVARHSELKLTESQISEIKESLLLSDSGCKGAYAKVQVIGRE
ncbi:uncharacterized protein LOC143376052 [Andrena cerasifolii]|uniref:uncharacterized protein LOC143376052 n=1 Tax=Andrena cerasifolii TaxID=2819439 RepID=UPI004037BCCA